jgi:hypothetical protein
MRKKIGCARCAPRPPCAPPCVAVRSSSDVRVSEAHAMRPRAAPHRLTRPVSRVDPDCRLLGSRFRLPRHRLVVVGGKVSIEHLSASKGGAARRWRNCSASRPWQKGGAASPLRRQVHNHAVTLPAAVAHCCSKVHKNPTICLVVRVGGGSELWRPGSTSLPRPILYSCLS